MLRGRALLQSSAQFKEVKKATGGGEKTESKILVVTGDSAIVRTLENILGEMGYELAGMRDRSQVEQYLNRQKPIMIICDADLPANSAYDLCHSLKGNLNTTSIPFVLIANRGEFPNSRLGYESGADDYITKPLERTEVEARIEPLLRRGKTGQREEPLTEEKRLPREAPEPEDILRETVARQRATEKPDKERVKLSSMDFIKKELRNKTQGEVRAKVEAKDLEEKDEKAAEPPDRAYQDSGRAVTDRDFIKKELRNETQGEVRAKVEAKGVEEKVEGKDEKVTEPLDRVYQDSVRAVTEWIDSLSQGRLVDPAEVEKVSRTLVEKIDSDDFLLLSVISEIEGKQNLEHRSVCTAMLSLKAGKGLGCSEGKLSELGVVALLHLVGVGKLLRGLGRHTEGEGGEEVWEMQNYPSLGAELLRTSVEKYGREKYSWLPEVVSQLEEREDGQGSPQGLTGDQIHEYTKILAVAKRYLDFAHPFSAEERVIPCEALKKIIQMQKGVFSPKIVSVFVKEIGVFPAGSWVRLSNGEMGMVVSNERSHPLRPTVEVSYGPGGVSLPSKRKLNLAETPFIFVSKPIDDKEIEKKE
jgi:response regulator RpfG family c-di-GMP phosphodiesterase